MAKNETVIDIDSEEIHDEDRGMFRNFLGGNIWGTVVKILLVSLLVGFLLAVLGISPIDFWKGLGTSIVTFFDNLFDLGWTAVYTIVSYVAFGAMIVVPVWLIIRLLNAGKK